MRALPGETLEDLTREWVEVRSRGVSATFKRPGQPLTNEDVEKAVAKETGQADKIQALVVDPSLTKDQAGIILKWAVSDVNNAVDREACRSIRRAILGRFAPDWPTEWVETLFYAWLKARSRRPGDFEEFLSVPAWPDTLAEKMGLALMWKDTFTRITYRWALHPAVSPDLVQGHLGKMDGFKYRDFLAGLIDFIMERGGPGRSVRMPWEKFRAHDLVHILLAIDERNNFTGSKILFEEMGEGHPEPGEFVAGVLRARPAIVTQYMNGTAAETSWLKTAAATMLQSEDRAVRIATATWLGKSKSGARKDNHEEAGQDLGRKRV